MSSGWMITVPDRTLQFFNLLPIVVEQAKSPVMMDNTLTPKAITILGTGEVPVVLHQCGMTIHDGVPPRDHDENWEPMTAWLFVGNSEDVQWSKIAATNENDKLRESIRWMAQTVHNAYHAPPIHHTKAPTSTWRNCTKDLCQSAQRDLGVEVKE